MGPSKPQLLQIGWSLKPTLTSYSKWLCWTRRLVKVGVNSFSRKFWINEWWSETESESNIQEKNWKKNKILKYFSSLSISIEITWRDGGVVRNKIWKATKEKIDLNWSLNWITIGEKQKSLEDCLE